MTDKELVVEYQKNKTQTAFNEILERYKNMIKGISRSYYMLGGDKDDVMVEGMVGLFKAVNTYTSEQGASFCSFAYTCITNQIKTAVIGVLRKSNSFLYNACSIETLVSYSSGLDLEELFIAKEEMEEKYKALKKILSKTEYITYKEYMAGYSYEEMATRQNKDVKSIDNTLQRVRKKLLTGEI